MKQSRGCLPCKVIVRIRHAERDPFVVMPVHSMCPISEDFLDDEVGSVLPPTPSSADGNGYGIHLKARGHVATLPAAGSEGTVISEDGKTLPRPTQAFHVAHFLPHPAASMTLDIKH